MAHAVCEPRAGCCLAWSLFKLSTHEPRLSLAGFPSGIMGIMELKVSYPNPAVSSLCSPPVCDLVLPTRVPAYSNISG